MVNVVAYIVPIILLTAAIVLFARLIKGRQRLRRIIAVTLLVAALIIGFFAYSGQLKPRCCGEGYTFLQTSITA